MFGGQWEEIGETWENLVLKQLERSVMCSEDLTTTLTQDSSSQQLTITHAADGLRSYAAMKDFCRANDPDFKEAVFDEVTAYLMRVCPLTVTFYLTLGPHFDYGIGLKKPVPTKLLSEFYQISAVGADIRSWLHRNSSPIATELKVSCKTDARACSFYLFEGEKHSNIEKGLSLFEHFAQVPTRSIRATLLKESSEELWCELKFTTRGIQSLSVTTTNLSSPLQLCSLLRTAFEAQLWGSFNGSLGNSSHTIEWRDDAFTVLQTSAPLY
jgi:hypothetical protein